MIMRNAVDLILIISITLKIAFIYGAMKPGNILFPLRILFEKILSSLPEKVNLYLRKPLFDCFFCCASVWGITFYFLPLPAWLNIILCVAGLNYLMSAPLHWFHDQSEKDIIYHKEIEKKEEDALNK